MVKKIILTLCFIIICTQTHAAHWIKYDPVTNLNPRCIIGDGVKVGAVAGYDTYDIPLSGWLASDFQECEDAKGSFDKIDPSIITGSRVVDWTQAEIDAFNLARQTARTLSNRTVSKAQFNQTHLKAFVKILLKQINISRTNDGLSTFIIQQLKDAINAEVDSGNSDGTVPGF